METLISLFYVITPWHWLILALVLVGLEMMFGTYDLLWLSAAAFLTMIWSALPLPAPLSGWLAEGIFFGMAGIGLVILGRTVFADLRNAVTDRPNLNNRIANMIGETGKVTVPFQNGRGRVKIGDTEWLAVCEEADELGPEQPIKVVGGKGTALAVLPA